MSAHRKINSIFNTLPLEIREKTSYVILYTLIRSILNFITIAGVISLIYILIKREYIDYMPLLIAACSLIIAIKSISIHYIERYCIKWYANIYKHLSELLLDSYLNRGLQYIKEQDISDLTYNTNGASNSFAMIIVPSIVQTIGNISLVILYLTALIYYSPTLALLLIILVAIFSSIYVLLITKENRAIGKQEINAKKEQWRVVQECFKGFAEITISNALPTMKEQFKEGLNLIAKAQYKQKKRNDYIIYLSETIAIIILISVYYISSDKDELIILLGGISLAIYKTLPAIKQIISSWSITQNQFENIETILEAIENNVPIAVLGKEATLCNCIELHDIEFKYNDQTTVISKLNNSIKLNQLTAIKGESGIGKSTLINLILGMYKPQKGKITIDGINLQKIDITSWHKKIGYVPQNIFITNSSIADNISLGSNDSEKKSNIIDIIECVQLMDWVKSLPEGINTKIGGDGTLISSGQKQRIGIARALFKNPQLLILDEATSALDKETECIIMNNLKSLAYTKTIIMITHNNSNLYLCDHIIEL